jgi:hypothetical protein
MSDATVDLQLETLLGEPLPATIDGVVTRLQQIDIKCIPSTVA